VLGLRKIEKPERYLTRAVRYPTQQAPAAAIHNFRDFDLSLNDGTLTNLQCANTRKLGAVFVALWKNKEQVFGPLHMKFLQPSGYGRAYASQNSQCGGKLACSVFVLFTG
jgi:hypothetical protein